MGAVKIKGNWNQNKGKLIMQFSNLEEEDDEIYNVEEELLRNSGNSNSKKNIKKSGFKKEGIEW